MSCPHLLDVPGQWREYQCGIGSISIWSGDCEECRPDCVAFLGLCVALGKVKVEDMPEHMRPVLEVAARQAADPRRFPFSQEREAAAVALGVSPVAIVQDRARDMRAARVSANKSRAAKARWAKYSIEERQAKMAAIRTVGKRVTR